MEEIRIATFNVSMEALNYVPYRKDRQYELNGSELQQALDSNHQQIRNIAEIIQTVNPDILLLNEFDFHDLDGKALNTFLDDYLAQGQNGQNAIHFPYSYQAPVNTGVASGLDLDGNGKANELPGDGYGFGYFPGHFGMVLLSKYPIENSNIRTFQKFKWSDMPGALKPVVPSTGKDFYDDKTWNNARLSSKSHWHVPISIKGEKVNILAAHPTPPVFDGPEDRNGNRNHDEIKLWHDYITPNAGAYIYDDNQVTGGLNEDQRFVIMGDLNASTLDGDANVKGIGSLLSHSNIQDPLPLSQGGKLHAPDNVNAQHHTAYWGMRADYVLPSKNGFTVKGAGVFWPTDEQETFRLIKDRGASSDHRMVWVDVEITPVKSKEAQ